MKIIGIIAEYDPFHNGHLYHLKQAKEQTGAQAAVVVMSGHFLQRGTPCMFPRDLRAAMAVDAGADLVLELPYINACGSSREFAGGAVGILNGLGCISHLCFGAESSDITMLSDAARALSDPEGKLTPALRAFLKQGLSYPEALTRAVEQSRGKKTGQLLRSPNNLLGIEYMKALTECGSNIRPVAIRRVGSAHGAENPDASGAFASGTAIRSLYEAQGIAGLSGLVPETTRSIAENHEDSICKKAMMEDRIWKLVTYRIMTSEPKELAQLLGVDEGLEHRLKSAALQADSLAALDGAVRSRRYTQARIRRMFLHILMNLKREAFLELKGTYYARVLGFSEKGRKILRMISETSSIPVFSNLSRMDQKDPKAAACLEIDQRAGDLYRFLQTGIPVCGTEKRCVPYRAEKERKADVSR